VVPDECIEVWDIVESRLKFKVVTLGLEPRFFDFSRDGRRLSVTYGNGSVRVWELGTGKELLTIPGKTVRPKFSPDGQYLLTRGDGQVATVWELATGEPMFLRGHSSAIGLAMFDSKSRRVVTVSDQGTAKLWDLDRAKPRVAVGEWVHQTAFSPGRSSCHHR